MNRNTLLALLIGLLLAAGVYLVLHKGTQTEEEATEPPKRDSPIARVLRETEGLVPAAYDEAAMRALVQEAGATLTPEQEAVVLPLLHRHALALRKNMEGAKAALERDPDADLSRYVMFATQAHANFQRTVGAVVSQETGRALFDAVPPMVPALPPGESPPGPAPRK